MASVEQVALVRQYTDEPGQDPWTDNAIAELIDSEGVDSATARIWREKAARYSHLVDVTEAGATRRMSQAFENAQKMAAYWEAKLDAPVKGRTRVHQIVRE